MMETRFFLIVVMRRATSLLGIAATFSVGNQLQLCHDGYQMSPALCHDRYSQNHAAIYLVMIGIIYPLPGWRQEAPLCHAVGHAVLFSQRGSSTSSPCLEIIEVPACYTVIRGPATVPIPYVQYVDSADSSAINVITQVLAFKSEMALLVANDGSFLTFVGCQPLKECYLPLY
jgi:hypothetical protein